MPSITDPALQNLELQIGIPAQQGFAIPESQIALKRREVISYLIIKGLTKSNCDRFSNEVLGKLYGIPNYLRTAINNELTGKNKYKNQKTYLSIDIETSDLEPTNIKPIPTPSYATSIPKDSNIDSQVRAIIQDANRVNRDWLQAENKTFQNSIITTVHNTLDTVLKNFLETNAQQAKETAKSEILAQSNEIKKLVEDIIFKSYLDKRISSQASEPQSEISLSDETIPQNSAFIPKIDPNYHFDTYATKVIRSALSMHENLYVYGDTGCGKTTHLEQVCAVLNRGLIRINPHDGITREMFLGGMKLINHETIFVEGALPTAMRNGYVFLVDEISFLPPNLAAILNPIGEKNGKLYIPETSEWITPAPGFCIFATDNTGGKGDRTGNYTGTEVQNTATLDRFAFCLKMDYLPQDKELEMLQNRFSTFQNRDEFEKMLTFARDIRSAFSRGELSITLSTRKLIKFFDQRENNFTISEALNNTILSWLDEDDETLVKTMIDRLQLLEPTHITSNSAPNKQLLIDFQTEVASENLVSAIKILRIIADNNGSFLGLKEAKDIAECYRDGLLDIQDVTRKIGA
jgi:cobaltochelatase CobS